MYYYKSYIPGNTNSNIRNTIKSINYIANYNARFPNSEQLSCSCIQNAYNKTVPSSNTNSARLPINERISIAVNNFKQGKIQFGNFYLGQPLDINYLGRTQGMPAGSGKPPKNNF